MAETESFDDILYYVAFQKRFTFVWHSYNQIDILLINKKFLK